MVLPKAWAERIRQSTDLGQRRVLEIPMQSGSWFKRTSPSYSPLSKTVCTSIAAAALSFSFTFLSSNAYAQESYELTGDTWSKLATYPPNSPEGKLQAIRKLIAEQKFREAQDKAKSWISQYPDNPMLVEAYLLRGDALTGRTYYYDALYDYEKVINDFPASEQFHVALEREFQIGRLFLSGVKRRLFSLPVIPADTEGEELLIRIQERAPGSSLGERASITLADYFYDIGDMKDAAEAYDLFIANYPDSTQREWALLRLIHASLARFKGPQYDPAGLIEAQTRLLVFQDEYPASAERIGAKSLLVRISESLALKDLAAADWYAIRENNISAAYMYRRIIDDYPLTTAAQQSLQKLSKLDVPDKIKLQHITRTLPDYQEIEQAPLLDDPFNQQLESERTGPRNNAEEQQRIMQQEDLRRGKDPEATESGDPDLTPNPEFNEPALPPN
ncbi:outer membrane protein assembly factor BamD [Planctomycetota bacterium]|nr:outer membrane protein assembly factor BamD [Planctomycetota bacterium]